MVTLEKAIIAKFEKAKHRFEIYVEPNLAFDIKSGKKSIESVNLDDLLVANEIFKDAKKGERASEEMIEKIFGTTEIKKVVETIIKKGELHLTTEQRRKMIEEKRKQIINIIARTAINPQTNSPHPPARIEKAIEEAKVNIDITKDAAEQVAKVVDAIRYVIPIKFEQKNIAVKIPPIYTGRAIAHVKNLGKIKKEEWLNDGSWAFIIEIPAGMVEEFFDEINKLTKGEAQIKVL